jgi:inhibitor of KinA sporulation pathway (predicted exonuclease)
MAKYFIDTEFIEGFHKPLFGKRRHFIDLISIGIVCEDGRTYYAISNQFEPDDADSWVKENVLYPIMRQNGYDKPLSNLHGCLSYNKRAVKSIQKAIGKHPAVIAMEIQDFCRQSRDYSHEGITVTYSETKYPEFYAYYADYDWVVFCSLFGRMIDLPEGFPMYCIDLKQSFDETMQRLGLNGKNVKTRSDYPKQENEHNALDDAKWNYNLFKFLEKTK